MKKALDQTIRDLKRGVNKKVLKVPGVEQKVLDATSNEPWGPHGSHLADIAQATRNYHEYQMIMAVLWKRINDTGRNWRHVYKALTVLEYLVANGSERVIDEIKEHVYQISTLSDFQYVDSSGKDQGNNVRKKSQSLVVLVNDKERILEARQKASVNREKFRTSSTGAMHRPGSYSSTGGYGDRYEDERYGPRDEDRNGYGREREWGKDDDRYGRGYDGDRYSRDSEDRYSRDDDQRGRRSTDEYHYGSRSRSSDGYKERGYDDDGRYSSRSSGARAEDNPQDESRHERKFSEQNIAPPPYEEAVGDSRSPVHDARDEETAAEAPAAPKGSSPTGSTGQSPVSDSAGIAPSPTNQEFNGFDEFDPRGSVPAPPPATHTGEMDLLGSLSDAFTSDALAIMPAPSATTTSGADVPISSSSGSTFVALSSASTVLNQPVEDPFGDSPFKATPVIDNQDQTHDATTTSNFQSSGHSSQPQQEAAPNMETATSFDFGDTFSGITYTPSSVPSSNLQLALPDPSVSDQNTDILADILPPSGGSQVAFSAPGGSFAQHQSALHGNFHPQGGYTAPATPQGSFYAPTAQPMHQNNTAPSTPRGSFYAPTGQPMQQNNNAFGNSFSQSGYAAPVSSQETLAIVTTGTSSNTQPPKKFEPKSAVWADTLSKGLVNLNISGPKTNPLADIGVDFDSINRKERRERPPPTTTATSTITMGKAMGSGSGMGRAGASAIQPPANPSMGPGMGMGGNPGMGMGGNPGMGMGMGMGGNPGMGMGMGMNMGNYGGMNQQQMGMGMGMGMGMNMGGQMRPPFPPGQNMQGMQGPYNPMMGPGGYSQQPYGGYR